MERLENSPVDRNYFQNLDKIFFTCSQFTQSCNARDAFDLGTAALNNDITLQDGFLTMNISRAHMDPNQFDYYRYCRDDFIKEFQKFDMNELYEILNHK